MKFFVPENLVLLHRHYLVTDFFSEAFHSLTYHGILLSMRLIQEPIRNIDS